MSGLKVRVQVKYTNRQINSTILLFPYRKTLDVSMYPLYRGICTQQGSKCLCMCVCVNVCVVLPHIHIHIHSFATQQECCITSNTAELQC